MNAMLKALLRRFARVARPHLRATGLMQTTGIFNRSALVWTPGAERVLVLAPHMDDETIGCGGTLALHARQGASITVVFLTDGSSGGGGIGALSGAARRQMEDELIHTRRREAKSALTTLGIADMRCLDARDGQLAQSVDSAAANLRPILDEVRPEIVYVPMFVDEHADHRAANRVLLQAVAGSSADFQCAGYEVWTPLFPNCLVDIGATMSVKREALAHYKSQLQDGDYMHASMGLSAYRSIALLGSRNSYAEAFHLCPFATYRSLCVEFLQMSDTSVPATLHARPQHAQPQLSVSAAPGWRGR
jgi:LmbE family N-acetylglucosaminyl deacetylase